MSKDQDEMPYRIVEEEHKPVRVLIHEAVEKIYLEQADRTRRRAALQRLLSLGAPTADWEQMEDEIIRGAAA